jgi:hypothetical protein
MARVLVAPLDIGKQLRVPQNVTSVQQERSNRIKNLKLVFDVT